MIVANVNMYYKSVLFVYLYDLATLGRGRTAPCAMSESQRAATLGGTCHVAVLLVEC